MRKINFVATAYLYDESIPLSLALKHGSKHQDCYFEIVEILRSEKVEDEDDE